MNPKHHAEFDPYSEQSLKKVEIIESLPLSVAFENVMYDNRLDRTAQFEYTHSPDAADDIDPLVIDPDLMISRFPSQLRDIFPSTTYTIENLRIQHIETNADSGTGEPAKTTLEMAFTTDQTSHYVSVKDGVTEYLTTNAALDDVSYRFEPEVATGLLAAFVHSSQYDPNEQLPVEILPSTIYTKRDPQADLVECMIMTLGDRTGHSTLRTRAIFETPSGAAVIASLGAQEFPDKSAIHNTLLLGELYDKNDVPTSTETTLFQNVVNIEIGSGFIEPGQIASRYAEQRSTTLRSLSLSTSEYIDPKANYDRWSRMCRTFLKVIKKPMKTYAYLDETNLG